MRAGATDLLKKGMELYRRYTPKDNERARALFKEAKRQDPGLAKAYAGIAATHRQDWILGWTQDPETSKELAYRTAQKAVEVARSGPKPELALPYPFEQLAYVRLYRGDLQGASDAAREAVQDNPNFADGYTVWAQALIYMGKPGDAIPKTRLAIAHYPPDREYPFFYDYHLGQAYYVWGFLTEKTDPTASRQYYQQAERHLREALRKNANFRPAGSYQVAVLYKLNRIQDAVDQMQELRDRGRPPTSEEYVKRVAPYDNSAITNELLTIWTQVETLMPRGLTGLIRRYPVPALLVGLGIGFVLGRSVGTR
jgi:adenylate cyclase